jgi:hypothetical protein
VTSTGREAGVATEVQRSGGGRVLVAGTRRGGRRQELERGGGSAVKCPGWAVCPPATFLGLLGTLLVETLFWVFGSKIWVGTHIFWVLTTL